MKAKHTRRVGDVETIIEVEAVSVEELHAAMRAVMRAEAQADDIIESSIHTGDIDLFDFDVECCKLCNKLLPADCADASCPIARGYKN